MDRDGTGGFDDGLKMVLMSSCLVFVLVGFPVWAVELSWQESSGD